MREESKISVAALQHVPETMLVPLFFKAKETIEKGVIVDRKAVEIVKKIDYNFSRMASDIKMQISIATRTYIFDDIVNNLYRELGDKLVIVNLGAGLDTREERFSHIKWYQLDLPESISIRKKFFANSQATLIPKSVLDFSWINDIQEKENILFIAEGLFMYFTEEEVRAVMEHIAKHFKNSFLTFNSIHKSLVGTKSKSVDTTKAPLKWGLDRVLTLDRWNTGFRVYKSYYPLDYFKKRWKVLSWIGLSSSFFRRGLVISLMKTIS